MSLDELMVLKDRAIAERRVNQGSRSNRSTDSETFTFTVYEVNDPPVALDDELWVNEDDTLYFTLSGDDGDVLLLPEDIQTITYSVVTSVNHGDMTLDSLTGSVIYDSDQNYFGVDSFLYSVVDNGITAGETDYLLDTAVVVIHVMPVNDSPVLASMQDTSMFEDSTLALAVMAADIDNEVLSLDAYTGEDAQVNLVISDTMLFIQPEENWNGNTLITVLVNDNMDRAVDMVQFQLTVLPVNDPPYFTMAAFYDTVAVTDQALIVITAGDIENDELVFTVSGQPEWLVLDNNVLSGFPVLDSTYTFELHVSDGEFSVSIDYLLDILDYRPNHLSLMDIPEDQGRQMSLFWISGDPGSWEYFTQFSIWRLVPDTPPDSSELWDFVMTVPWNGLTDYNTVVPTLGDSTIDGIYLSTFRVTGHTEQPNIYFDSETVTSYSMDNLAPSTPQNITVSIVEEEALVTWSSPVDTDFKHHLVYRENVDDTDTVNVFSTVDSFFVDLSIVPGTWKYSISAVDSAGNESEPSEYAVTVLSAAAEGGIPDVFALHQNYPNPFNPVTQIRYDLPEDSYVTIIIYDIMGRNIKSLVNTDQTAGYRSVRWNATYDIGETVSAGMYIYMIQAGEFRQTKKMVLLK